jgi:DNA end-binding protein Ku
MKAIWSGALGFGMVQIPVKLFGAVETKEIHLEMLDRHDEANIKLQRINANTGKEVVWEDIVKGYKLKDKYVILEDEDLETVIPEKNKLIEIIQFVDESEIDSIYYDTPYYLQPDKAGTKPYCLLREALIKTNKAALSVIGRI